MPRPVFKFRDGTLGPFEDFYKEMDHLVRDFFDGERPTTVGPNGNGNKFTPRANVVEEETLFEVTFDLPGINVADVQVEVVDDQLSIAGERKSEVEETTRTVHRVERTHGTFRRVIALPSQVDESKITAEYKDGVLKVTLPKSEKVKPKRIEVQTL